MSTNYMSMKDPELKDLIKKFELEEKDYLAENGSVNRKKLNNVLKLIDAAAGSKEVLVQQPGEELKEHKPTSKLHKGLSGMMVNVTFYNSDDNDLPYVQMALNGIALIIPRERETWIPKEFIDGVLNSAIITRMKMDVQQDGKIRYIPKNIPRVQYTVHAIKHIDELRKEFDEAKKNKK